MNAVSPETPTGDWNGLRRVEATLPKLLSTPIPSHFQLELEKIWYRNWIYLCRAEALETPRAYRTFKLGTQSLLVLRDDEGALRAFHNTCAHRGAALCTEASGHLSGGGITCRYHAFTYGLDGRFLRRPAHARPESDGIRNLKLHAIQIKEWQGFIFVNLAMSPRRSRGVLQVRCGNAQKLASGRPAGGPCPGANGTLQLEDPLGKLQRVPALPGRASIARPSGADLSARHHGAQG